jgi:hypothetical protein
MGSLNAIGMQEAVNDGLVGQRTVIAWHLQSNHYPPLPSVFIDTALDAVEAFNDEDYDRLITLPEGIEWKDGRAAVEAHLLVESFHLDSFVTGDDYDEDGE